MAQSLWSLRNLQKNRIRCTHLRRVRAETALDLRRCTIQMAIPLVLLLGAAATTDHEALVDASLRARPQRSATMQRTFRLCGLFCYKPKRATVTQLHMTLHRQNSTSTFQHTHTHIYICNITIKLIVRTIPTTFVPRMRVLISNNDEASLSGRCLAP